MKRRRAQSGYTLIEVMMAVGIMTVGAVGIMALQQATTRGNGFAREMTTANDITRTWVERLRLDGLRWTQPGAAGADATTYLGAVPDATNEIGEWGTFGTASADPAVESYAFDYQGVQTDGDPSPIHFCTNVRLRWVLGNAAIRADVRTWWHRSASDVQNRYACEPGTENAVSAELAQTRSDLHAVYGTILIRPTPVTP